MFDRSAITEGRRIQDFGLCDLNGVYQLTAKLRAKGWMVVTFFSPDDSFSAATLDILSNWSTSLPSDKVSILGVLVGDRSAFDAFKARYSLPVSIVWDFEGYWAENWGISALPTTFITDTAGRVLDRFVGADAASLDEGKNQLTVLIEKAAAAAKAAADAAAQSAAASAPAPASPEPPKPIEKSSDAPAKDKAIKK